MAGISESAQLRVLCRSFLARFFESETTASRGDLRESFFWLTGALGGPAMLLPVYLQFRWYSVSRHSGKALVDAALTDTTLYLALTAVAMLAVCAVVWPALLLESRDGLILGGLPLRARTIVIAKIGALVGYALLLNAGMHTGASLLYGSLLGALLDWTTMYRVVVAHFVASVGLGLFIFGVVIAIASLALAVAGPRQFARVSGLLQLAVVAATLQGLRLIPMMTHGSLTLTGTPEPAWLVNLPVMWFLGLDATIAGMANPQLQSLATTAIVALGMTAAVIAVTFPLAAARTMRAVTQTGPRPSRIGRASADRLTGAIMKGPHQQATGQFALATLARVGSHRLILLMAVGVGLVAILPVLTTTLRQVDVNSSILSWYAWLASPLVLVYCALAGVRTALALPAELDARWVFAGAPSPMFAARDAAARLMMATAVLPPALIFGVVWSAVWGPLAAAPHVAVVILTGWVLVEIHLWGFVGPPCARPLAPGSANLQSRWPAYLGGLILVCVQLPLWQAAAVRRPANHVLILGGLVAALVIVRRQSRHATWLNAVTGDPQGLLLLDLSAPQPNPPGTARPGYARPVPTEEGSPNARSA